MVLAETAAAITTVKSALELSKTVKELTSKSDNVELQEAAIQLRLQTVELKAMIHDMSEHITELEGKITFKEKLDFNGKCFEYEQESQTRYICNGCEAKGMFTHMTEHKDESGYHGVSCPQCKNNITLTEGNYPQTTTAYNAYEDF